MIDTKQLPTAAASILDNSKDAVVRSLCRRSFERFVREFWDEVPGASKLIWNWHIGVFCGVLQRIAERVFRGEPNENDVICNLPPGTSKSTVWSILFPAWAWTNAPWARIMTGSHADQLVMDLANKARHVIKSEKYRRLFPEVVLRDDQDTKGYYANTRGGDRITCTVGGKSPMGFHAHFIIVDDPIDPKKVISDAELKSAREFVTTIIPSRKVDKAITVTMLVMQRLGVGDPTDVMLEEGRKEGAIPVLHYCLPAELKVVADGTCEVENLNPPHLIERYQEAGGLMDPLRLGRRVLNYYRAKGEHYYATQFQQRPFNPSGGMFRESYFLQRVRAAPWDCVRVRYWDRACLVAGTMVVTKRGMVPIEHVRKGDGALTRDGSYREVSEAWETKRVNRVVSVLFSNGSIVTGTPDHLVWTENRSWVSLADLRAEDTLLSCVESAMAWDGKAPITWPLLHTYRDFSEPIPVYDLAVEDAHEFFANGILVHNSTQGAGCRTAGVLLAKSKDGDYYIEHVVVGQWEPTERNRRMKACALRDRARYGPQHEPKIWIEREGGSSGRDAWKSVAKVLEGFPVFEDTVTGNKETRAEPWSAQLAAMNVYVVDNGESDGVGRADWDIQEYVKEHLAFPLGEFLDQVDASSGAFNLISGNKVNRLKGMRILSARPRNVKQGILWGTRAELAEVVLEDRCLLVYLSDPPVTDSITPPVLSDPKAPEGMVHGLDGLLESLTLYFADLDPAKKELQESWDEPILPWNRRPEELKLLPEQGKTLWRMLLKKRETGAEQLIFVSDPAERALSVALAVADAVGIPREAVNYLGVSGILGKEAKPPNPYVYDIVRRSRAMVL